MKPDNLQIDLDLISIIDFLEDRGVDYSTAGTKNVSAGWIGTSCLFCGDRSNHLGINLENNLISCFKCGKKGSILNLIQEVDRCSYRKAKETALKFVCSDFSHLIKKERNHAETTMFPAGTSSNFLPIHDAYLMKRRYDRKFLEHKYDIQAIGPTCDDWKFRVLIPVYLNHDIVTYVARDVSGKAEIPYKNCPAEKCVMQVKDVLYGIDNVKEGGTGIIVEGLFDAWRIGTGALCSFGTQYTANQLALLANKRLSKVCVMFDQDATSKGRELAHTVSSVVSDVELILLDEGDPDDLTEDEVWQLRRDLNLK